MDLALAGRLGRIAEATYLLALGSPFAPDPSLGFLDTPKFYVSGSDLIDACLLGTTQDGIVLAFRGTLPLEFNAGQGAFISSLHDWLSDGRALLITAGPGCPGKVHQGFFDCVSILEAMYLSDLTELLAKNPGQKLFLTGHSKGGAVAVIAAASLAASALQRKPDALFTFAAARPGDTPFVQYVDSIVPVIARFEFQDDIVPHLPPTDHLLDYLANSDASLRALSDDCYDSAGSLAFINWDQPPSIVEDSVALEVERAFRLASRLSSLQFTDIGKCHSLENAYLPVICGTPAPDPGQVPLQAYSAPYAASPGAAAAQPSSGPKL